MPRVPPHALTDAHVRRLHRDVPWATPSGLRDSLWIGNPDLDGLLCLALVQAETGRMNLSGWYSGEVLLLTDEGLRAAKADGLASFVYVEGECYTMRSMGHHLSLIGGKQPRLNPNRIAGFGSAGDLTSKYPFGLLPFLWRIFERAVPPPGDPARADVLRVLFYPDGGLLKNLQYAENCANWLDWLGLGVAYDDLRAVAALPASTQLARCLYKSFGSTQFGLTFQTDRAKRSVVTNLEEAVRWVNVLGAPLGFAELVLPRAYRVAAAYRQHRVPARRVGQLQPALRDLAISDALVNGREWSVTLPRTLPENLGREVGKGSTHGLPAGLSREPPRWVRTLGLAQPCTFSYPGCDRPCGR